MPKISSCQSIKFGASTDVLKVYAGSSLVWDSGVVPPVTEFPPSAIYAWDFDVVTSSDETDYVLPKVGSVNLQLPVLITEADPFSGIRSGTLAYGTDFSDDRYPPVANLNSTQMSSVRAISGSFRIDEQEFPNPGWANGDFLYLCAIRLNDGGVNNSEGDVLLGFELVTASPPVRGDWDLVPQVWRNASGAWVKGTFPYATVRVTEGDWFTWHAKYEANNLNLTITNKSGATARVENISTYWYSLIEKFEFSGTITPDSNGLTAVSTNCSWDNLALHDVSFQSNDPQPLTCERYAKYFIPESGAEDDLFIVWDFNRTDIDPNNGLSNAWQSCEEISFGSIVSGRCNANGSCEQVAPMLPDQYYSCRLNKTLWTPDNGIAADHRGLSYWFSYNGDDETWPGVVLGSWLGGNQFLLVIETVYDALTATKPRGTRIVASIYDLFDPISPEVPIEQWSGNEETELNNSSSSRFYVQISNRANSMSPSSSDSRDWFVEMGQAYFTNGQVQFLEKTKTCGFSSVGVNWDNNTFVSLNKTPQGYEVNSGGRDITIDKVAFWVNPDVMGFDAL